MNKFKKSSKSKSLTFGIAILSSAAIVSTGFAAWVISGGAEASVSGTITADTVVNNQHTIEFTQGNLSNLGKIFYGRPDLEPKPKYDWLSSTSPDTDKQNLSVAATFTVANVNIDLSANDAASIGEIIDSSKTKFVESTDATADASTKYATFAATGKNYVDDLPAILLGDASDSVGVHITFKDKDTTNKATFNLKIVFGWGSAFGKINPYNYYGAKPYTKDLGSEATTKLDELSKMNATFKLTLVTK